MAKYLKTKQRGNLGEAFVESMLSEHAIVHKIDGSKDVGIDMICEWVNGEKPTQTLFAVQIKTQTKPLKTEVKTNGANFLKGFRKSVRVKPTTFDYWKGFDFPVFIFLVTINEKGEKLLYYKRYTPVLHGTVNDKDSPFYLAIKDARFQAYVPGTRRWPKTGGFCRDLFFDTLRCQHNKGLLSGIDPNALGLEGWDRDTLYAGVYDDYLKQILSTLEKYKSYESLLIQKKGFKK